MIRFSRAILLLLLCACVNTAFAATPDELWQNYQKHPGNIATTPQTPRKQEPPTTVIVGKTVPPTANAKQEIAKREASADKAQAVAAQQTAPTTKPAPTQTQGQPAVATQPKVTQRIPAVADNLAAAAKPKLQLVKPHPRPRQFLRTPQAMDFTAVTSTAGYSLAVPTEFGKNPLEGLPQAEGSMLVRASGETLLCAVNVIDAQDSTSFQSTQPLPDYAGKQIICTWKHTDAYAWHCTLSRHADFNGSRMLLQAQLQQEGKTCELLYVMPAEKFTHYLPMAIYSMDSFRVNAGK